MKIMPYFLPIFSFTLPAAIVVYFLVSNLYRIGQQWYITRSMYHGEDSLGAQVRKNREDAAKQEKKGGNKGGNSKSGGNKSKGGNTKSNGASGAKKKPSTTKSNGSNARKTSGNAPGRNTSGRQGSARSQVQPKARKKKKR